MIKLADLVPDWVWKCLGAFVVFTALYLGIVHYVNLVKEVALLKSDNITLTETNSNLAQDNRKLIKDMKDLEAANKAIDEKTVKSDSTFDSLEDELKVVISERDALEVAVAAQKAAAEGADVKPTQTQPTTTTPVKKPTEINILWKAYCLDSSSAKCQQVK